jgi:hypothetical protein
VLLGLAIALAVLVSDDRAAAAAEHLKRPELPSSRPAAEFKDAQYLSQVCRTPINMCFLPAPQPINSPCFCPYNDSQVQGLVTFN